MMNIAGAMHRCLARIITTWTLILQAERKGSVEKQRRELHDQAIYASFLFPMHFTFFLVLTIASFSYFLPHGNNFQMHVWLTQESSQADSIYYVAAVQKKKKTIEGISISMHSMSECESSFFHGQFPLIAPKSHSSEQRKHENVWTFSYTSHCETLRSFERCLANLEYELECPFGGERKWLVLLKY